jgi:hypothetical protein
MRLGERRPDDITLKPRIWGVALFAGQIRTAQPFSQLNTAVGAPTIDDASVLWWIRSEQRRPDGSIRPESKRVVITGAGGGV